MPLLLVPLLVVVAYLLWPEAALVRLGAVAAVLAVAHIMCEGLYEAVTSRGTSHEFSPHFGNFLLVVVLGTVLAVWWGWRSTAVIVTLDLAWHLLSGLLGRAMLERPPRTTEQHLKTIKAPDSIDRTTPEARRSGSGSGRSRIIPLQPEPRSNEHD